MNADDVERQRIEQELGELDGDEWFKCTAEGCNAIERAAVAWDEWFMCWCGGILCPKCAQAHLDKCRYAQERAV